MAETFAALAEELADQGYDRAIPLRPNSKAPRYAKWERFNAVPVSDAQRETWIARGAFDGIGLAAGGPVFGLDLDHREQSLAFEIRRLADLHIGETPVWRVGQPHKSLRFYHQDVSNPIETTTLRDLDIGLYGTTGQWVLYGTHPITRLPYTYPDESPLDVAACGLPPITRESLDRFLAAVDPLIPRKLDTGAGRYGVAYECQEYWEHAKAVNPDARPGDVMARMMRETSQRHPTMSGIVAFLSQCGWDGQAIINAIAEAYLEHFEPRELPARYAALKRSIAGAEKKGIARDANHLIKSTGFAGWGKRRG